VPLASSKRKDKPKTAPGAVSFHSPKTKKRAIGIDLYMLREHGKEQKKKKKKEGRKQTKQRKENSIQPRSAPNEFKLYIRTDETKRVHGMTPWKATGTAFHLN